MAAANENVEYGDSVTAPLQKQAQYLKAITEIQSLS
jgi:hypothetical protein